MSANQQADNRQSVRVTSRILFVCYPVAEEKYNKILEDFNNGISLYNRAELSDIQMYIGAQSALARLKDKDEDLAGFLQHLDGKINMLLDKVDDSPSLLDSLSLQTDNISGNGMAFWSKSSYSKNDILELQFVLQPGHIFIDCFVKVVKCKKEKVGDSTRTRVSVRFLLIMDADRENLIQYNFKQQSLALKRRRMEKEA